MEMRLARADDGGQIGFRHAIRRDLPMLAFGFVGTALLVSVVASGETSSFRHKFFAEQRDYGEGASIGQIIRDSYSEGYGPPKLLIVALLQMAWSWAEAITMLSNRRRRALHDFLGGTIVVSSSTPRSAAPLPPMETPRQSHRA
jgi:uncharacterized RDD family membrane protein YckC